MNSAPFTMESLRDAIALLNKTVKRTKLDDKISEFITVNNCTVKDIIMITYGDLPNTILPTINGNVLLKHSKYIPYGQTFIMLNEECFFKSISNSSYEKSLKGEVNR